MSSNTEHFQLLRMRPGESFSQNDGQFLDADRQTIDRELWFGRVHHHNGAAAVDATPDTEPSLELSESGGSIPAGTRVYYKFSYVDENGAESGASPEAFVDTPAAVGTPNAPTVVLSTTGGSLLPGTYFYVLSAYTGANTNETRALNYANVSIPTGTTTNLVTLTLPTLPAGADGFNVYRRRPGTTKYFYVGSIDMDVATPPTTFVDDGSLTEDCDRTLPVRNSTNSENSVTVCIPGATPVVPEGYTWKLYRTYVSADWSVSLLHHVVEETTEGSGIIAPCHEDTGIATEAGSPVSSSQTLPAPSKVDLTDGDEVQGRLPMSQVSGYPHEASFLYRGFLQVTEGFAIWMCPFPNFRILSCRAALGKGSAPASQQVIVDVNKGTATATPVYTTIYTTQANRPRVQVGQQIGQPTTPDVIEMVAGESLTVDIDQHGAGATPTDEDLTVTIFGIIYGFTDTDSVVW